MYCIGTYVYKCSKMSMIAGIRVYMYMGVERRRRGVSVG
jgi:hypothetical protein